MSTRATARHRASVRPVTPLSSLTTAVNDHVGSLGRGGVVVAMSSGLVATIGLPASAAQNAANPEAKAPATASINSINAVQGAAFGGSALVAAPAGLTAGAPVIAPATAKVAFETGTFKAVPKKKPVVRVAATPASSGSSARSGSTAATPSVGAPGSARGSSVLAVAARYVGVPYLYGGTTASGFDCSGAMRLIYGQVGISLPRTANEQMNATTRISRSAAKAGDLVFFLQGGRAYHVGIYVGGNMMYDAGRTGKSFSKREIFSSNVVFGRA